MNGPSSSIASFHYQGNNGTFNVPIKQPMLLKIARQGLLHRQCSVSLVLSSDLNSFFSSLALPRVACSRQGTPLFFS
ncbi:hypothetical protein F3Y22_tig00117027pilonHSYRG00025 [Hibiscus syriacus]|uniref:Uncharacterized protein n=1 Tax=Hibiscus syriacus TaxID=106335 RepID=A0A6A2WB82_HIBSY|nr:hypothetical protein F3Y22_tig00117027pilonHSYRG00025 [Hibiscus syriacus]